jgi:hypothetical protein
MIARVGVLTTEIDDALELATYSRAPSGVTAIAVGTAKPTMLDSMLPLESL